MKTKYDKEIKVSGTIGREAAEWLLKQLKGNTDFEWIVKGIEEQLKPLFGYKITCCGCGNKKDGWSRKEFTKEEIKKMEEYWLCGPCMDSEDFK